MEVFHILEQQQQHMSDPVSCISCHLVSFMWFPDLISLKLPQRAYFTATYIQRITDVMLFSPTSNEIHMKITVARGQLLSIVSLFSLSSVVYWQRV